MSSPLSPAAQRFFEGCNLAKALTGVTPAPGTHCWIFHLDPDGGLRPECAACPYFGEFHKDDGMTLRLGEGFGIIELKGTLSLRHVPGIQKNVDQALAKEITTLFFDCRALSEIDPAGIGVLARTAGAVREKEGQCWMVGARGGFKAVLEQTGLAVLFEAADTVDAARKLIADRVRREQEEAAERARRAQVDAAERDAEEQRKMNDTRQRSEQNRTTQYQQIAKEALKLRCYDFFNGQHPSHATPCSECYYKIQTPDKPCWIVQGDLDGLRVEYTDEDCLICPYYQKFNPPEIAVEDQAAFLRKAAS